MEPSNKLIEALKEIRAEVSERIKMLRYYGVSGIITEKNEKTNKRQKNGGINRLSFQNSPANKKIALIDRQGEQDQVNRPNFIKCDIFKTPPLITFICYTIPRKDTTSSEYRLFHIIKILLELNCRIELIYCHKLWNEDKYRKEYQGNINYTHLVLDTDKYENHIFTNSPQYLWISELWRLEYTSHMTELCRRIKRKNQALGLIVDTVDFHYKEFNRKYKETNNLKDLERAKTFLEIEKVLYKNADIVIVISKDEMIDIRNHITGIKRIEVVPNIHECLSKNRPFNKRSHICFVGHFGNQHNVDAVRMFLSDIWPEIYKKNPKVEFHIIGFNSDSYKEEFRSKNVKVIGGLKYLELALAHYRLFVCPMTYGAGMKGKIGGAFAAGLPVVTTTIGAEGFGLKNGKQWYIADDPRDFASKCDRCLNDSVLWNDFHKKSIEHIYKNLSPMAVKNKLRRVFIG